MARFGFACLADSALAPFASPATKPPRVGGCPMRRRANRSAPRLARRPDPSAPGRASWCPAPGQVGAGAGVSLPRRRGNLCPTPGQLGPAPDHAHAGAGHEGCRSGADLPRRRASVAPAPDPPYAGAGVGGCRTGASMPRRRAPRCPAPGQDRPAPGQLGPAPGHADAGAGPCRRRRRGVDASAPGSTGLGLSTFLQRSAFSTLPTLAPGASARMPEPSPRRPAVRASARAILASSRAADSLSQPPIRAVAATFPPAQSESSGL